MLVVILHFIFVSLFHFCIFILLLYLHLSIFFIHISFSFQRHPSTFRGLSPSFYTHIILSAQPIVEWFAILSFSTFLLSSYREGYRFEWAFFTHRCFLPYTPSPTFLTQPAFIKAFMGAGSSSLKFAWLHTDPRNTDPAHLFVWFTVIHKLHIQNNSILNSTIY